MTNSSDNSKKHVPGDVKEVFVGEVKLDIKAEHSQQLVFFGNDLFLVGNIHLGREGNEMKHKVKPRQK